MNIAIIFALGSLCFAGMNDVVFKRYAAEDRSRGMLVFGVGLIWLLAQGATVLVKGEVPPRIELVTLVYGTFAAIVLTASNILLIESLAHIEIGLGSTIYRLNTVGVVLLSFLFLGEQLGWLKIVGISFGVCAVLLLTHRSQFSAKARSHNLFVGLVILASLLRAVYGVVSKAGIGQGADIDSMILMSAGSWVLGGALYAKWREGRFRITGDKAVYALVSGILVYLIVNFLIAAIARADASVVIPIANLSFVAALMISVVLGMECLSTKKMAAVVCAILSIWILSLS